ncbi:MULTISPECIES: PAS and ANTAR domain-containing protein [Nocardioides]|uniref:histidine kinase n=1 Tax=Nocardioides vastitatis TaxID=2568655 RepID=A0ABW0ZQ49_9ACTN|nr:PAS and ANTAR domain-containing protein [Nocardioides sp.]THI94376.1 ANTAR domain-containing protein [Nocardioides sp.]
MSAAEKERPGKPTAGQPRIGRFSYDIPQGVWEWDDEVFRIYGLAVGSVRPTTDYMLQCKHPEDRDRVAAAFAHAAATGEALSVSYRVLAADGVERKVVVVCEGGVCEDGPITAVDGYFIDLTEDFREESEELVREAITASAANRATIEQAKGSLMLAYGVDADQAFAMLNWWSRNKNVKVRDLAERLVEAARTGATTHSDLRTTVDALLHDLATSPERVASTESLGPTAG